MLEIRRNNVKKILVLMQEIWNGIIKGFGKDIEYESKRTNQSKRLMVLFKVVVVMLWGLFLFAKK